MYTGESKLSRNYPNCVWSCRYSDGLGAGRPGFGSRQGQDIYLSSIGSSRGLGLTQSPLQCVPGPLSLGIKRPWREADHPPSSKGTVIIPLSNTSSWRSA
jgi:hypothetical protein